MSTTTTKPCPLLLRTQVSRGNVGQVAHVSPTPRVNLQKVDITHCTLEAACWFWLGFWSNNDVNSHPSPGPLNNRVLRSCLVQQFSHTINDVLRIVTGCLRPTTADNLPILAGIQPAELCRKIATLSLARRAMAYGHLFNCSPVHPVGIDGV